MSLRLSKDSSLLRWTLVVAAVLLSVAPLSTTAFVLPRTRLTARDLQRIESDRPQHFLFTRQSRAGLQRNGRSINGYYRLQVNVTGPRESVFQDEQTVLECVAFGPKPATIYWLKNGEKLPQDGAYGSNIFTRENHVKKGFSLTEVKSKLFIDCASLADEAEYTCVAATPEVTRSASYKLQLSRAPNLLAAPRCRNPSKKSMHFNSVSPARITMWTHNKLATSGMDVILVCRAQGSNVALNWYNEDTKQSVTEQNSDRFRILDNGDLEIKNIRWEDMGGYACSAENELGSDRQTAFLYPLAPNSEDDY
ncbi:zwei Ig domain protein zig-4 [Galendromus occidentalis]|uniref:Zwei Ig domain protein zig-4 n=1 Tax=Galendromus occidentalis TaxID=34638 RepID=A0AAJ6QTV0_9ACAR|nr:zwei Ig domain protein zig-4 [Galendromus occidentalis]